MEDEDELREQISAGLTGYGYTVLNARNDEEALLICEEHQEPIHLMLTDIVMPQISGRKLAGRLSPLNRQMKVIYLSGHAEDIVVHHQVLDKTAAFIQKPFTLTDLILTMREILNSSQED